jgi:hypothetical protein
MHFGSSAMDDDAQSALDAICPPELLDLASSTQNAVREEKEQTEEEREEENELEVSIDEEEDWVAAVLANARDDQREVIEGLLHDVVRNSSGNIASQSTGIRQISRLKEAMQASYEKVVDCINRLKDSTSPEHPSAAHFATARIIAEQIAHVLHLPESRFAEAQFCARTMERLECMLSSNLQLLQQVEDSRIGGTNSELVHILQEINAQVAYACDDMAALREEATSELSSNTEEEELFPELEAWLAPLKLGKSAPAVRARLREWEVDPGIAEPADLLEVDEEQLERLYSELAKVPARKLRAAIDTVRLAISATATAVAAAKREAEEQAKREAEEQAKRGAEEQARKEAEEQSRKEAEEQSRKEAEEQARKELNALRRKDPNTEEYAQAKIEVAEYVRGLRVELGALRLEREKLFSGYATFVFMMPMVGCKLAVCALIDSFTWSVMVVVQGIAAARAGTAWIYATVHATCAWVWGAVSSVYRAVGEVSQNNINYPILAFTTLLILPHPVFPLLVTGGCLPRWQLAWRVAACTHFKRLVFGVRCNSKLARCAESLRLESGRPYCYRDEAGGRLPGCVWPLCAGLPRAFLITGDSCLTTGDLRRLRTQHSSGG